MANITFKAKVQEMGERRMTTWTEARKFLAIALTIDAAVILALWALH